MTRIRMRDLPPEKRKRLQAARREASEQARESFTRWCIAGGLPAPVAEHRFHPIRKWRFDYAWPTHLVALEIEGGVFVGGRHNRGAGFREDLAKYSEGAALGWRIVRTLPEGLYSGVLLDRLRRAIAISEGPTRRRKGDPGER